MRATWKKVWRPDGSSEEWPDGQKPEEIVFNSHVEEPPMLLCDRETADRLERLWKLAGYDVGV